MSLEMPPAAQRSALTQAIDAVLVHGQAVREKPVSAPVDPRALRRRLDGFDLEHGSDVASVIDEVVDLLENETVLTTHPRYFGLFNPSPLTAGIVADVLTAGFNPQLAVWSHAPAAVEIEAHLIRTVGGWLGVPTPAGSFTSGGAEANATAVLLALQSSFPQVRDSGIGGLPGRPVFYASTESHLAWLKIAQQCGLGRDSVRLVPVDRALRLDTAELTRMLRSDRRAGALPFLIVATAGTTSAGVIDPLPDIAELAAREGVWFHVDAAWAGAGALSDILRAHLSGIESADSVTVDAHKWLSVPMGAGMLITRHGDLLPQVFDVETSYMPARSGETTFDPYTTSMQWSRRASGLKLFLALAIHGRGAYARQLEQDTDLAAQLRDRVRADGWSVVNDTPLPVVCIADRDHVQDAAFHEAVAAAVVASGSAWISTVAVNGQPAIRACVISHRTTSADVGALVAALHAARREVMWARRGDPAPLPMAREHSVTIRIEDPASEAARRCLEAYALELAERLEEGFDLTASLPIRDNEFVLPDGLFLIATMGTEPVGCVALNLDGPGSGHIKRMWTASRVRGSGLGRRLLTAIETQAFDLGVRRVRLETNRALHEAIDLYRTSGYEEVDPWNEEPYADHWFEKLLTTQPRTNAET